MHGLVIRSTGSFYTVQGDDGTTCDAKVKGNFRLRGIRSTNPVAVGDRVTVEGGFITEIDDRKNYVIRRATNLSKQSHILAANVDQCLLVVTLRFPETTTTFIDRFLASAEAYRIPVVIVFNKVDLLTDEDDLAYLEGMQKLYETVGYTCLPISATTGQGMDALQKLLHGKVTLLSGHSGVGKSTLINRLCPGLNIKTAEISDAYDTGKHTTTFSEMYPIEERENEELRIKNDECRTFSSAKPMKNMGNLHSSFTSEATIPHSSFIIDTPGIKGFGTFDFERTEVGHYFKEIFRYSADCRFNDCTHTHEPGCAVLAAVERHDISESRYHSYLSMLDDKDEDRYRADH